MGRCSFCPESSSIFCFSSFSSKWSTVSTQQPRGKGASHSLSSRQTFDSNKNYLVVTYAYIILNNNKNYTSEFIDHFCAL